MEATEAVAWSKCARRLMIEARTAPEELGDIASEDFLRRWSDLIEQWAAAAAGSETFRWTQTIDNEVAHYLLHGLETCLASTWIAERVSGDEIATHGRFTRHVAEAFIAGLAMEGLPCEHYAERLQAL